MISGYDYDYDYICIYMCVCVCVCVCVCIYIYMYICMGVFTGGGGLIHPLTGVFVLSADFSEYGVLLLGVCYTFSGSH